MSPFLNLVLISSRATAEFNICDLTYQLFNNLFFKSGLLATAVFTYNVDKATVLLSYNLEYILSIGDIIDASCSLLGLNNLPHHNCFFNKVLAK